MDSIEIEKLRLAREELKQEAEKRRQEEEGPEKLYLELQETLAMLEKMHAETAALIQTRVEFNDAHGNLVSNTYPGIVSVVGKHKIVQYNTRTINHRKQAIFVQILKLRNVLGLYRQILFDGRGGSKARLERAQQSGEIPRHGAQHREEVISQIPLADPEDFTVTKT